MLATVRDWVRRYFDHRAEIEEWKAVNKQLARQLGALQAAYIVLKKQVEKDAAARESGNPTPPATDETFEAEIAALVQLGDVLKPGENEKRSDLC